MQRTLNRELKELEVVGREAIAICGERLLGKDLTYWRDRGGVSNWLLLLPQLSSQAGISLMGIMPPQRLSPSTPHGGIRR